MSTGRTAYAVVKLTIALGMIHKINIFQALYSVFIPNKTQQGTFGVAVKRLCEVVLPVSTGLQDVKIVPFLPAISPAVASCAPGPFHHLIRLHH